MFTFSFVVLVVLVYWVFRKSLRRLLKQAEVGSNVLTEKSANYLGSTMVDVVKQRKDLKEQGKYMSVEEFEAQLRELDEPTGKKDK